MDAVTTMGMIRHYTRRIALTPPDDMSALRTEIQTNLGRSGYSVVTDRYIPFLMRMADVRG